MHPIFQIRSIMTYKWNCGVCHKSLSSKQMVVNHLVKLHPTADNRNFTRTQTADKDENNKHPDEISKPLKKPAYSSFNKLHNIFSDESLCEKLELYPKKSKELGNEYIEDVEGIDDLETRNGDLEYVNGDADLDLDIGVGSDSNSLNPDFGSLKNLSLSPPSSPVQVDDLLSNGDGFSSTFALATDSLIQGLNYQEKDSEINSTVRNRGDDTDNISRVTKVVRDTFQTPFKVRGKCGCVKCSLKPCGQCYNCLHKEAK